MALGRKMMVKRSGLNIKMFTYLLNILDTYRELGNGDRVK